MVDKTELEKIFREVTATILKEYNLKSPHDINNGQCDIWASRVAKRVPEAEEMDTPTKEWNNTKWAVGHVWIVIDGVHYDCETVKGVKNWRNLKIFKKKP